MIRVFMSNKILGAFAANMGSADGGLSSIAVCSLHGCNGRSVHVVVLLVSGFTGGLLCGVGLVLCFWATSTIRNGLRTAATAEAVSVFVEHRQNDRSGIRRGSRDLCPETDSEDSFDGRHVQHQRKDGRTTEQLLLDSHSRRRRVARDPSSLAGNRFGVARREERTYSDDNGGCCSPAWCGFTDSEFTGEFRSLQMSSCERFSERERRRTRARRVRLQGCLRPQHLQQRQTLHLGAGLTIEILWFLVKTWRTLIWDARVLSVQRNSAGDRHREFCSAVADLVQSPWAGWPVSGPRTFLWCCQFMSEHTLHPLAHHSRFVQLSGLLPTDPAAQEHELQCRVD